MVIYRRKESTYCYEGVGRSNRANEERPKGTDLLINPFEIRELIQRLDGSLHVCLSAKGNLMHLLTQECYQWSRKSSLNHQLEQTRGVLACSLDILAVKPVYVMRAKREVSARAAYICIRVYRVRYTRQPLRSASISFREAFRWKEVHWASL